MSDRTQLIEDAHRVAVNLKRLVDAWEDALSKLDTGNLSLEDQKGVSFQAVRAARDILTMLGDVRAAVCWTRRLNQIDNVPPELIAAINAAMGAKA